MNECKVIHKQTSGKDSNSVIFDSISRLTSFVSVMDQITHVFDQLHNNIYLCVEISTCYNERVQSYSQTNLR